jgi:hypothetical protein
MGLFDSQQDAAPSGLFGQGFNDPRSAAILALAGSMVRGDFGGGLMGANKAFQDTQDSVLKRADVSQQIGLRNIQLQQAVQQWKMMQPILQQVSSELSGGGAVPGGAAQPAQPAIGPTTGGGLGSGTFGIPTGGQPAASAPQGSAFSGGGGGSVMGLPRSVALTSLAFGGPGKFADAVTQYNSPTDLMKTLISQGVQPGTPQWNQAMQGNIAKTNYIAPVNARPGSIIRDPLNPQNVLAFNPHIPEGGVPQFDGSGNVSSIAPLPGATAVMQAGARAAEAGKGDVTPFSGVDATGAPLPVTNRTAAATQGQPVMPAGAPPTITNPGNLRPAGASTGFQNFGTPEEGLAALDKNLQSYGKQGVNTVSAIISKWAPPTENNTAAYISDVSKRLGVDPGQPLNMDSPIVRQALSTAITLHEQGPSRVFSAPQQTAGAIYTAPPLGTVTNADASQKASADSMKESYTRLQTTGTTANSSLDALDKMMALAAKKNALLTVGPLGTHQSAVNPDAAEYEKQRANVIALMAGSGTTDAGRANVGESVPDFGKPKEAIADGLGTLRNQLVAQQLKRTLLTPIYQAGDSKKYTTLENQFDQNVSPKMVPLLTMQPGPQRAAALKEAASDPAMRARLNWAAENGLLK